MTANIKPLFRLNKDKSSGFRLIFIIDYSSNINVLYGIILNN